MTSIGIVDHPYMIWAPCVHLVCANSPFRSSTARGSRLLNCVMNSLYRTCRRCEIPLQCSAYRLVCSLQKIYSKKRLTHSSKKKTIKKVTHKYCIHPPKHKAYSTYFQSSDHRSTSRESNRIFFYKDQSREMAVGRHSLKKTKKNKG